MEDASECPEQIGIVVNSLAMEFTAFELALVVVAIIGGELAFSSLLTANIIALILDFSKLIELDSVALLLVIEPFSFV